MIEPSLGLTLSHLDAVAALETRTIDADGGRLKLEWGTLRSRDSAQINDVLWWDGSRLLGFLGIYCFDGNNAELAGMVDPTARRQGIGAALVDAAVSLCQQRSFRSVLLVVPRHSDGGRALALRRNGVLDHSEYALTLNGAPNPTPSGPDVSIRNATVSDAAAVTRLLTDAFGHETDIEEVAQRIATDLARTMIVEFEGNTVGTVRLSREGNVGGIYGFAVDPPWQGRGIGREVLLRVCQEMKSGGVKRIGLEVATQNEGALGLYTSVGFTLVTTEDYYALPI